MSYHIDIQHATSEKIPVTDETLVDWSKKTLSSFCKQAEFTLRLVTLAEITELNHAYRQQNKATNVLSFPANLPKHIRLKRKLLGDVIICPDVLVQESHEQNKSLHAHWAHIVIHGILHLLGFDHIDDKDAIIMQQHEIKLLADLGFDNPYAHEEKPLE